MNDLGERNPGLWVGAGLAAPPAFPTQAGLTASTRAAPRRAGRSRAGGRSAGSQRSQSREERRSRAAGPRRLGRARYVSGSPFGAPRVVAEPPSLDSWPRAPKLICGPAVVWEPGGRKWCAGLGGENEEGPAGEAAGSGGARARVGQA